MQSNAVKQFSPDDVITALLALLPDHFSNDPEKIHETIYGLQKEEKYKDLLGDFEFIGYSRFHYSPLLGRILNRLQESRLLSSRNPGYVVYEIKDKSQEAIKSYFLEEGKTLHRYRNQLEEIARCLAEELANAPK